MQTAASHQTLSIIISKMDKSHSQLWCPGSIHVSFFFPSPEKDVFFFIQAETAQSLSQTWQVNAKIVCRPLIEPGILSSGEGPFVYEPKTNTVGNSAVTEDNTNSFSCVWTAQQRLSWTCHHIVSHWGQAALGCTPALNAALATQSLALPAT